MAHEPQELHDVALSCLLAGDYSSAEAICRAGAIKRPWDPEFRFRLGSALIAQGRFDEATLALADARTLEATRLMREYLPEVEANRTPDEIFAASQMLFTKGQYSLSGLLARRLIPDNVANCELQKYYGLVTSMQGRIEEACAIYETVVRRQGCEPDAHSYLHLLRIFQQTGPETLYEEGRRWSRMCEATVTRRPPRPIRQQGRLRIGYYSATFNRHQLGHFFLPILEAHDTEAFEIFCYSHFPVVDDIGQASLEKCTFRQVGEMSDDEVCDLIEADGIDILIDLWGHSQQHRLMVFARRPAPVQVSYLNYINTTGLKAFDYVLLPDGYRAPGDQAFFSEQILSIGPVIAPYRAFDDVSIPEAAPHTLREDGLFTFASAAHPAKINPDVARAWAEILKRTPHAILELRYMLYRDPVIQRAMVALFEAYGVTADRLHFPEQVKDQAFRQAFAGFDLVLDPFPYQGMTTTMDALSMGVPVLALEGAYLAMKVAPAALRTCGIEELIAPDIETYIEMAVSLAHDPARLDALRRRLRPGFAASAFRKEEAFTRRLEATFQQIAGRVHPRAVAA